MTVLVDPPLWPAHGRLWSHVASDTSLDELHAFATCAGIPRRSFEGDHYDIPEERYADVVAAGATPVSGTELARRLAASGLRFRKRKGERPLARVVDGLPAVPVPHVLDVVASPIERERAGAAVVLIRSGGDEPRVVLVRNASREGWDVPGGKGEPGDVTARDTAVREVAEEIGVMLDREALEPVGYERIRVSTERTVGTLEVGDNYLQVYTARLPGPLTLTPDLVEVLEAEWVTESVARQRCGEAPWWPLAQWWWAHGGWSTA